MSRSKYWQEKVEIALKDRVETNEIDFKKDLSEDHERLKEHVNAFGNAPDGGLFVYGVQRDFTISKQTLNHEKTIEHISKIARDSQAPALQVLIHHLKVDERQLLAIEILPGSTRPVFIRGRDPWTQGAFVRNGNTTRVMTDFEIRDLLANSRSIAQDAEPLHETTLEQLDKNALETYLNPFRAEQGFSKINLQILEDNRVIKMVGPRPIPTLAGWLMFAINPQTFRGLKNASIELQLFAGRTREMPTKKLEIFGTLSQQVALASDTLLQTVWKVPKLQGLRREDLPSYDETTLREVITNAVVHRDYRQLHQPVKIAMFSDRIEMENPGGLLPGLTPLNLLHKRAWRNETIANLMLKAGLGEMDGQGIDRIYGAITRLKVPAPIIQDEKRTFKITLNAPKAYEHYSPLEKRLTSIVLLLLEQEIDNEAIRNAFGIDRNKASTLLKDLVNDKTIYRTTKSMKFARYRLTEEFRKSFNG